MQLPSPGNLYKAVTGQQQSVTAAASNVPGDAEISKDKIRAIMTEMMGDLRQSAAAIASREYITQDPDTLEMLRSAQILAGLDCCVTILGPTGTGKEIIANIIHAKRRLWHGTIQKNFKAVNCSGIVPTLFESLLFGHLRGSFTGATADRDGLLVTAGTKDAPGTAFLDEVGDLPLDQQAKLLRVIQNRTITPVGSTDERPIYCRFVFATNKNLEKMVEEGQFREDLYYRITTAVLRTKPLIARPGDAEKIAMHICQSNKWEVLDKIPEAVYAKGNVRQLYNWLYQHQHGLLIEE